MAGKKDKIIIEVNEEELSGVEEKEKIRVVSFSLGGQYYCIDIKQAKEAVRLSRITKVPNTPEFIAGVMNLRGEIITLIDLRYFFGITGLKRAEGAKLIVTDAGGSSVGILVDTIEETLNVDCDLIEPPLVTLRGDLAVYTKGEIQLDGKILVLLDMEKILDCEEITRLQTED